MDALKDKTVLDGVPLTRLQGVPGKAVEEHVKKLNEKSSGEKSSGSGGEGGYSLNDDRRVKVLSPGALVAKRFFRNRIALVGLVALALMFAFSFIGGIVSPYGEDEQFYREDYLMKEYASAKVVEDYRYLTAPGQTFGGVIQAQLSLALKRGDTEFESGGTKYVAVKEGEDLWTVSIKDGAEVGFAYKDVLSGATSEDTFSYEFTRAALAAFTNGRKSFEAEGASYTIDDGDGVVDASGREIGYISRYFVNAWYPDVFLDRDFKERLEDEISAGAETFRYTDDGGAEHECVIEYDPANLRWVIKEATVSRVLDTYSPPSLEHPLGTDRNGMDMITRLMYGGRVSLIIGFIVEIISTVLGVIMGGISGYFGKWVDNLIMRIVDVFYCIPSTPILIILGAAMDTMSVDPKLRMVYLMLILGFLGWPGMARLVRGQILSLREQEFMTATEATGLTVHRRIFKHLVPNVIPQLIVSCTMGLGSTIIMEATLSFLGLGVKYPFASWGNIINDVTNTFVLTSYWFVWIPAGVLLLITVLAFNLVGDGLRDAFDPKMKR